MTPKLIPLPTTIEPRKPVLELSRSTRKGGSVTTPNEITVATASGKNSSGSAAHQRKYSRITSSTATTTSTDDFPRSADSADSSSTEVAMLPAKPTRNPGA